jgi:hypothetical protein
MVSEELVLDRLGSTRCEQLRLSRPHSTDCANLCHDDASSIDSLERALQGDVGRAGGVVREAAGELAASR